MDLEMWAKLRRTQRYAIPSRCPNLEGTYAVPSLHLQPNIVSTERSRSGRKNWWTRSAQIYHKATRKRGRPQMTNNVVRAILIPTLLKPHNQRTFDVWIITKFVCRTSSTQCHYCSIQLRTPEYGMLPVGPTRISLASPKTRKAIKRRPSRRTPSLHHLQH